MNLNNMRHRASTEMPHEQQDHSLTYMLVLLLLLIIGSIIGLHVAFVLNQTSGQEHTVQSCISSENGPS
jgi:type III secretory pathway component EscS